MYTLRSSDNMTIFIAIVNKICQIMNIMCTTYLCGAVG